MFNYNLSTIPIIKDTNLAPTSDNYLPNVKDVFIYKKFTKSV